MMEGEHEKRCKAILKVKSCKLYNSKALLKRICVV